MKVIAAAAVIVGVFTSTGAWADGPVAQQASFAIAKATQMFIAAQPAEVRRNFQSVSANLTAHERFDVTIALKDATTEFKFDCTENEDVDPVIWECVAK